MPHNLPEFARQLAEGETFCFACHPDVPCFTECCRSLDLSLTPYDVMRLKHNLGLTSQQFLQRFVQVEIGENDIFPHVFLAMNDGDRACPFVSDKGCRVYDDRPAACRTYPLGRAASMTPAGVIEHFYVILREPHCRGFEQSTSHNVSTWLADQELELYNSINDELTALLQHPMIKQGFRPTENQQTDYLQVLYDLDDLRSRLTSGKLADRHLAPGEVEDPELAADDLALLRFGLRYLHRSIFGRDE